MPPLPCALRALQQVLPQYQLIQPSPTRFQRCKLPHRHYPVSAAAVANPSVAGAVDLSTDAALAPTRATATPTNANPAALAEEEGQLPQLPTLQPL